MSLIAGWDSCGAFLSKAPIVLIGCFLVKPKQIDDDGNRRYIIITHSLIVLSYAFVTNIFFNSAGSNDATGEPTVWYDRKFRLKNTPTSTRGAAGFSDFVVQTVYGFSLNSLSSDPSISATGKQRSVP